MFDAPTSDQVLMMTTIKVPKPPKSALNKDRPISTLLKNQIRHLQEAEFRLPVSGQTDVYINAIKTEGEAAEYIRQVTAAIHAHHAMRAAERMAKSKAKSRPRLSSRRKSKAVAKNESKNKKKRTVTIRSGRRS